MYVSLITILQFSNTMDYMPVVIQLIIAFVFTVPLFFFLLRYHKKTFIDNSETGLSITENPVSGKAGENISANKFFISISLFVLFGSAMAVFYPYVINLRELGWNGFWPVMVYIVVFSIGYIYAIKSGILNWKE